MCFGNLRLAVDVELYQLLMVETYFWKGFEMLRQSKSSKSSISPSRDGRQIFLHCLNGALFGFQRVVDLPFNPGLSDFLTAEQEVIPFAGSKAVV